MKEQEKFEDIETIAQYGTKSLEQMERHAAVNAGFHDYEQDSFADKQMIGNLCTQYKVFFESDPKFSSFLDEMKAYADLDPYNHEDYLKEQEFVQKLPQVIEEMNTILDEQEQEFLLSNGVGNEKAKAAYDKLSPAEKQKVDREFVLKEETIDNRRRALASFEMYFSNIRRGELKDLDNLSPENAEAIKTEDAKKKYSKTEFTDEQGRKCYYINSVGTKLDNSIDRDGLTKFERGLALLGDLSSRDVEMRDAPLFPHEPRLTDISQQYSGECYLYAALQDLVRLYPQKIKNMIKDNEDGTCTVRFFGKTTNKETNQPEFHPVYVRVDKIIPKFGTNMDRMANDCLWVNMIERAYAMSGLHKTAGEETNLPIDLSDEKNAKWKPSIKEIEGGHEYEALETLLGSEGVRIQIAKPDYSKVCDENAKLRGSLDNLQKIKDMDVQSADSITRHAFFKFYQKVGGKLSEAELQAMDEDKLISTLDNVCATGDGYEYFEDAYNVIKKTVEKVLEDSKGVPLTSYTIQSKISFAFSNSIEEYSKKNPSLDDREMEKIEGFFRGYYDKVREGILEAGFAAEIPGTPLKDKFFNDIKVNLDKGFPLSCGTKGTGNTIYATEKHAYSLIGAHKTNDVPPVYFFRVKNPHTKLASENGMEYTNENGQMVGKWVNVEDGIFDIKMEDFLRDYEYVYANGSPELEAQPHRKVEGYDIIAEGDVTENERGIMTAGRLTDIMKVSNDLYDAMVSTNSKYSNDSEEYKNLLEGIKQFRHNLASANGKTDIDMKKLTDPLVELTVKYDKHVKGQILGPSKRQQSRQAVCKEIRKVMEAINNGRNPLHEYQREYAKTLAEKFYDMNGIKDKSKIDEVAERMFNNKAFRKIANDTNITRITSPEKGQVEQHLKKIESNLKGRGVDKGIDMATMKPKTGPAL